MRRSKRQDAAGAAAVCQRALSAAHAGGIDWSSFSADLVHRYRNLGLFFGAQFLDIGELALGVGIARVDFQRFVQRMLGVVEPAEFRQ